MNETSFAHILFATGVPGKLFDKLRAVSFIERPRRTCPVLTGRVEDSLISQIITIFNQVEDRLDTYSVISFADLAPGKCFLPLSFPK